MPHRSPTIKALAAATLAALTLAGCGGHSQAETGYLDFLEKTIGAANLYAAATQQEWVDMGHAVCNTTKPTAAETIGVIDGVAGVTAWTAANVYGAANAYLCPGKNT